MLTALIILFPEEVIPNWCFMKMIQIPFIPSSGDEISFHLNTASVATVEIKVDYNKYNTGDDSIEIHCRAPLECLYLIYFHAEDWAVDDKDEFLEEEKENIEDFYSRHPRFKPYKLR